MPFKNDEPEVRLKRNGHVQTLEVLEYEGQWGCYTVPAGLVSDFATIPRVFTVFLPRADPRWALASFWHDHYCNLLNAGLSELDSRSVDRIFALRMARESGTGWLRRYCLYYGVRVGALFGTTGRRRGIWRDVPFLIVGTATAVATTVGSIWLIVQADDLVAAVAQTL